MCFTSEQLRGAVACFKVETRWRYAYARLYIANALQAARAALGAQ